MTDETTTSEPENTQDTAPESPAESPAEPPAEEAAPLAEAAKPTNGSDADPWVVGKAEQDEIQKINQYKAATQQGLLEIGRLEMKLASMDAQVAEVRSQKDGLVTQLTAMEVESKRTLEAIASRFGIEKGAPWQFLPDGTVKKVDPEAFQAAQAAQAAAQAQAQAKPQAQASPE